MHALSTSMAQYACIFFLKWYSTTTPHFFHDVKMVCNGQPCPIKEAIRSSQRFSLTLNQGPVAAAQVQECINNASRAGPNNGKTSGLWPRNQRGTDLHLTHSLRSCLAHGHHQLHDKNLVALGCKPVENQIRDRDFGYKSKANSHQISSNRASHTQLISIDIPWSTDASLLSAHAVKALWRGNW